MGAVTGVPAASQPAPPPVSGRGVPAGAAPAAPGFADLLAGHLAETGGGGAPAGAAAAEARRTVTLGEMIASLGGAGAPPDPLPGGSSALAGGGALAGAVARGGPAPRVAPGNAPAPGTAPAPGGPGEEVLATARAYLGIPYRWGGDDPATGLDCSGLVQRVFADLGVALPRVSADQSRAGEAVPSLAEATPGDLVFWRGTGGRPNHIGIYAGDGRMIHAPRTGDVVRLAPVRAAPPDAVRRVR